MTVIGNGVTLAPAARGAAGRPPADPLLDLATPYASDSALPRAAATFATDAPPPERTGATGAPAATAARRSMPTRPSSDFDAVLDEVGSARSSAGTGPVSGGQLPARNAPSSDQPAASASDRNRRPPKATTDEPLPPPDAGNATTSVASPGARPSMRPSAPIADAAASPPASRQRSSVILPGGDALADLVSDLPDGQSQSEVGASPEQAAAAGGIHAGITVTSVVPPSAPVDDISRGAAEAPAARRDPAEAAASQPVAARARHGSAASPSRDVVPAAPHVVRVESVAAGAARNAMFVVKPRTTPDPKATVKAASAASHPSAADTFAPMAETSAAQPPQLTAGSGPRSAALLDSASSLAAGLAMSRAAPAATRRTAAKWAALPLAKAVGGITRTPVAAGTPGTAAERPLSPAAGAPATAKARDISPANEPAVQDAGQASSQTAASSMVNAFPANDPTVPHAPPAVAVRPAVDPSTAAVSSETAAPTQRPPAVPPTPVKPHDERDASRHGQASLPVEKVAEAGGPARRAHRPSEIEPDPDPLTVLAGAPAPLATIPASAASVADRAPPATQPIAAASAGRPSPPPVQPRLASPTRTDVGATGKDPTSTSDRARGPDDEGLAVSDQVTVVAQETHFAPAPQIARPPRATTAAAPRPAGSPQSEATAAPVEATESGQSDPDQQAATSRDVAGRDRQPPAVEPSPSRSEAPLPVTQGGPVASAPAPGLTGGELQRIAATIAGTAAALTKDGAQGAATTAAVPSSAVADGSDATAAVRVLTIALDPPEYGRVNVRLSLRGGALALRLNADSEATTRLLARDHDRLSAMLKRAGCDADLSIAAPVASLQASAAPVAAPTPTPHEGAAPGANAGGDASGSAARGQGGDRQTPSNERGRTLDEPKTADRRTGALYV